MRVFVTGASGFVGSATVQELIGAGHSVLGLARSEHSAAAISALGGEPLRGSIDDLDSLSRGAAQVDGVIHTAFNHNFSTFLANCEADRAIIQALAEPLKGSDRPLIVTSGTGFQKENQRPTEFKSHPRLSTEETAGQVAAQGVRISVIRLPPSVHDVTDHGFVPMLIKTARDKGVSAYVGDGLNQWPSVHRPDAASLYRLALERGAAEAWYHAVGDTSVPFKAIAEAIGRGLGIPVVSLTREAAPAHFGFLAGFVGVNCPNTSVLTQELLGWNPVGKSLLEDLDQGHYFA